MPHVYPHLADLKSLVGGSLGASEWIVVDQAMIDRFAEATLDRQWIHVDPERAAQGPFGGTVAHGFLTLSLLPAFFSSSFDVGDTRMAVNYGLNRVRFPAPVPVNSRLRAQFRLLAWNEIPGGAQLIVEVTVEREGGAKPVCVAESIVQRYF